MLLKRGVQRLESLGLKVVVGEQRARPPGPRVPGGRGRRQAATCSRPGGDPAVAGCSAAGAGYGAGRLLGACSTGT
ncbi:hypothetical protein [Nonomuraea rubra]|uniref:hypothetical protein n=1 Tax=Nonomuraea rubra TaxID=46180 RepID=UPI0031E5596B